ncbi:MAG: hypothetical protein AAF690_22050 [Acidobacteriota bacterium]
MRLFLAALRYEWLLQSRSARARFGCAAFLLGCWAPAIALALGHDELVIPPNAVAYATQTGYFAPFLTLVLSALLAGNTAFVPGESLLLLGSRLGGAGWLVRRLLVQITFLLALCALAVAGPMAIAFFVGALPARPDWALQLWLLELAPRVAIGTIGWFGLVRVLRTEVGSLLVATLGLTGLNSVVNQIVGSAGVKWSADGWTGFDRLVTWFQRLVLMDFGQTGINFTRFSRPSDRPLDPPSLSELLGPQLAVFVLPAALALLCFAFAVTHLGRCVADQPPVRENHPLRTYLKWFEGFRTRLRADGGLTRNERIMQGLAIVIVGALLTGLFTRSRTWLHLAEERYAAHVVAIGETMSEEVVPSALVVRGDLRADGSLQLEVEQYLTNRGTVEQRHFSFEINRHVELYDLKSEGGHSPSIDRRWDRVVLRVEPALLPGQELALRYRVRGTPATDRFALLRYTNQSFAGQVEGHLNARFPRERSALAQSSTRPLIRPSFTELEVRDLVLEPRWETWQLTPPQTGSFEGRSVLEESLRPVFRVDLDLQAPPGWILADACGTLSEEGGRLSSSCRLHAGEFRVAGGRRRLVASAQGLAQLAVIPSHDVSSQETALAMERIVVLSDRAWPGLPGLDRVVALEQPFETYDPFFQQYRSQAAPEPRSAGRLVLVPETAFVSLKQPEIAPVVGAILAEGLELGRPVASEDRRALWATLRTILLRRMGIGADSAWVTVQPWDQYRINAPVLSASAYDPIIWGQKVPALLVMLEGQIGRQRLMEAVEEFVRAEGDEDVTVGMLFEEIEQSSGRPVGTLYEDFFTGRGVPILMAENLKVEREGRRWVVEGELRNRGRGRVECAVLVRTESGEHEQLVAAETGKRTPFRIETAARPHTLLLDPARRSLQLNWPGRKTTWSLLGASGDPGG